MFGTQSMRLLRENWQNATMLAEELYAIFQDQNPVETRAPIIIGPVDGTQAPLSLQPGPDGKKYINFVNGSGDPGGFLGIDPSGNPALFGPNGEPTTVPSSSSGSSTLKDKQEAFVIKIVSGSGDIYQCNVYPNGRDALPLMNAGVPVEATAKAIELDPTSSLPLDYFYPAWLIGEDTTYWFQPPIFLGPTS